MPQKHDQGVKKRKHTVPPASKEAKKEARRIRVAKRYAKWQADANAAEANRRAWPEGKER